jgi:hypothetical protein
LAKVVEAAVVKAGAKGKEANLEVKGKAKEANLEEKAKEEKAKEA